MRTKTKTSLCKNINNSWPTRYIRT